MSIFWQQLLIGVAIALSVLYLVIYYVRRRKRKSACSACPTLKTLKDNHR